MAPARETVGRLGREAAAGIRRHVLDSRDSRRGEQAQPAGGTLPALHWMTAALLAATGADAIAATAAGSRRDAARLAPLLTAPLAGAAHAARAVSAAPRLRLAARLLDAVAAGAAVAVAARIAYDALAAGEAPAPAPARYSRRLAGALLPLTMGATAVLGLVLEHEERRESRELRRLRRRARVVERLVPRHRAHLDRIVLHV